LELSGLTNHKCRERGVLDEGHAKLDYE
jgi:hypothetical protein